MSHAREGQPPLITGSKGNCHRVRDTLMWQSPSMRSLAFEGAFSDECVRYLVKRVCFQGAILNLGLGVGAGSSMAGSD